MSYLFSMAKSFVEKMIEEGKNSSEINEWLEENPFIDGDFTIDTALISSPSKIHSLDPYFSSREVETKKRVRPPCNYLKIYLGSKNLWKKEYEEFELAMDELESALKKEEDEEKLLEELRKYRKTKERYEARLLSFDTALERVRKLAFEEKLMYDIEHMDIIKGFNIYQGEISLMPKREKILKEKPKPAKLIIPFTISLIDLESMLIKAFLFHAGYLAGEPEIFEKIGKNVYGLRTSGSLTEEEILRKALGKY